ncbi:MAG: TrbG/VirB9 family P-type conjugative transfer protein [Sphingopyxis sp.]|uniref:TrbG/VirB9 family P-type conjugative transfer protein n=1 Tax=Sphingopyxis sp. TaxID=1908224 RepID=UPI003D6C7ACA
MPRVKNRGPDGRRTDPAGGTSSQRTHAAHGDGRQIFIEFGDGIAKGDMPPLFAAGEKGEAELLNYRVHGRYMIVDRLFERGELRMGAGRAARRVIIERAGRVRGRS